MVKKNEKYRDLHEKCLKSFNDIQTAVKEEREQCLADRRFYSIAGAQWEGVIGDQFVNKPKFEINKIHLSVIKIINEYRNNRISVNFINKDDNESRDIDFCQGLFRADEQDSVADEAYDNAFEEAVGGGIGAWRLRSEYEDDDPDNEYQRIRIEPIFDADNSVFFDLSARRYDKSDAKYCFVITPFSLDDYEEEFGDNVSTKTKHIAKPKRINRIRLA
jgi:hypothetical protein